MEAKEFKDFGGENARVSSLAQQDQLEFNGEEKQEGPQSPPNQMTTFVPMQVKPNVPPMFKTDKRWTYLTEYINDFYIGSKKSLFKAIIYLALGLFILNKFAPGALLMIALAGRYYNISWWQNEVLGPVFSGGRALLLVK